MKKLITIASLVALAFGAQAQTTTVSQTIAAGGFTNLFLGPLKVSQIILTGTNNSTGLIVDSPTNSMTYVTLPYTNTISYITNQPVIYTNYFGVLTTNATSLGTNMVLVDVSQTVAQSTNNYPTLAVSCTTTPLVVNNANTYFYRGVSFTNTGTTTVTLTVVGVRQ